MRRPVTNESGMAIITALLVLMLVSGLMAGMFAALIADQRSHATDRDQSVAYAAAHAGLEKLTASLAGLFSADFSPSAAQIGVIDNTPPAIPGFEYTAPGGGTNSGYQISFTPDPGPGPNTGNPLAFPNTDITTGPFEGFKGLITPYTITVTAKSTTGNSEVRLRRELQTVAVPVFQFGIFGEKTLGFHAGPNFDFGGRVHTNQSLHLASGDGSTLTFRDKITAFTQVVRNTLTNGVSITLTNHEGTVRLPVVIGGALRNLAATESSGTSATPCISSGSAGSACWSGWKNLSESTYATNIRTERTGAKQLNLPLASQGATPIDLIKRPLVLSNEDVANPPVFGQRFFAQASVRILLSDRASDITGLPTITAGAPVDLSNLAASGYVTGAGRTPAGTSPGEMGEGALFGLAARHTRVRGNPGGTTVKLEWSTTGTGGWTLGVPPWMKWSEIRMGAGAHGGGGTVVPCLGMNGTQLLACTIPAGGFANGSQVRIQRPDAAPLTLTMSAAVAAGTNAVSLAGLPNNSIVNQFMGTRTFFAGEDAVTCMGFAANGDDLLNCGWDGNGLVDDDPVYVGSTITDHTPFMHGFLKIEKQNAAGVWSDVTMELLNLGFAGVNQSGQPCADPTPNAVIRLQRLRDNGLTTACTLPANDYSASLNDHDFWPNTLFDAREGNSRLLATSAGMNAGGVFSYVALDVNNFRRWVGGAIGATGAQALNNNGYIVYFSDRRGDHNEDIAGDPETGEFGFEDSINPVNAAWAKDNVLNVGEDFNENGLLESYGETPHALVGFGAATAGAGFDSTSRPWTALPLARSGRGRLARPVLFRRALKIVNGGMVGAVNNVPIDGFTVTSENPVYVHGNFNATSTSVEAEPNAPTAIIADSITLLSNAFNDTMTFVYPNNATNRNATETGYRFAMITGKTVPFPKPGGWGVSELGSDGGVHNFMKMLEDWAGQNLRYRGSMVSLFFSRQAVGIYRADANVYGAPTRGYNFDSDFLTPALLPPGTPMFRDINTLKFRQILRPNQ